MPMREEIVMSGENKSDLAFKMMDYICYSGRNFLFLKKKKKENHNRQLTWVGHVELQWIL